MRPMNMYYTNYGLALVFVSLPCAIYARKYRRDLWDQTGLLRAPLVFFVSSPVSIVVSNAGDFTYSLIESPCNNVRPSCGVLFLAIICPHLHSWSHFYKICITHSKEKALLKWAHGADWKVSKLEANAQWFRAVNLFESTILTLSKRLRFSKTL